MIIDNEAALAGPRIGRSSGRPLRVGIAGAGWVTQYHLPAWAAQSQRAAVVAIADPDAAKREKRQSQYPIPHSFATAEEMLHNEDIDILDICAPREAHSDLARLATGMGVAVLCQKPLGVNLRDAEDLVRDLAPDARLMVHDNWRFRSTYRQVKRWLDADVAGTLNRVELDYLSSGMIRDEAGTRPALVRQPMLSGLERLLVMEVLIHQLDTLRFLLGELDVVDARLARSNDAILGEDIATLTMRRRDDGLPVELVGNLAAHGEPPQARDQLRIFGSSATIALDGYRLSCAGAIEYDEAFDPDQTYRGSYASAIAHFLDCLETGLPFETNPSDNLNTLALVEAAYRAADDVHLRLRLR